MSIIAAAAGIEWHRSDGALASRGPERAHCFEGRVAASLRTPTRGQPRKRFSPLEEEKESPGA